MNHKLYRISFDIKGTGVTVSVVSDSFEPAIKQAVLNCKDHVGDQFKDDVSEDCISGISVEVVALVMSNGGELKELVSEHGRLNEAVSLREEVNRLLKEVLELQESLNSQVMETERLKERNKILVTGSSQLRNEVSYLTKEIDRLKEAPKESVNEAVRSSMMHGRTINTVHSLDEAIEVIDSLSSSLEDGDVSVSTENKGDNHVVQS
jgi:predicted RNase H-like nuclease (RuvC/YqgF family)